MSNEEEWRWADPSGQQRLVRTDELRAALASGAIPSNAPVWRAGWNDWRAAEEVPELQSSALAAQNGVLPNIPPPPLFVVAAQSDFEGQRAPAAAVKEPPAPPRYTPTVTAKKPPPVVARAAASPKPAAAKPPEKPPAPKPAPAKPAPKPTTTAPIIGASKPKPAEIPMEAPTTPDLSWDDVSVPADANTAVNEAVTEAKAKAVIEPASPPALPTMIGVPALQKPAAKRVITPVNMPAPPPRTLPPKAGQLPEPSPPPAAPQKPTSIPPPKRPTLMLYGGAPGDAPESSSEPSAPIVVPPPEPSGATKNMVTRPPPWSEGAAEISTAMPKAPPPPRALPEAAEELSGSLLLSDQSNDVLPHRAQELSSSDLMSSDSAIQVVKPAPLTPSLPVTTQPQRPMGTMMGMAPPPMPLEPLRAKSTPPPIPATTTSRPPPAAAPTPTSDAAPPPADSLARLHDLAAILRQRPKWQLAAIGGVGVLVVLGMFGMLVHAVSGSGDKPAPSASVSATATPSASVAPAPTPVPTTPTPPVVAAIPVCSTVGSSHVIAPKAVVGSGVEVHTGASGLTLGFATTPKDGVVMAIDPVSMAATSTLKPHFADAIKRVQAGPGDKLTQTVDFDTKGDTLQGRRGLIGPATRIDVGAEDGGLVYAPAGGTKTTKLFDLPNADPVEALRGDRIPSGGFVIAMRQGKAVVFGAVTGEPPAPKGSLVRVEAKGVQVGSPSVATNDTVALVAWAEKSESWSLRLSRFALGEAPDPAINFELPDGGLGEQALSPSVAALAGGGFLLVWTEGPTSNHQVRAIVLDGHAKPAGKAFTVSDEGVNAGQGQAAVLASGKGVVAYLASGANKTFQVVATSIDCH